MAGSRDTPVKIVEAVDNAQSFWDKMGALDGYDPHKNLSLSLSWHDYVRAKQHFGRNRGLDVRSGSVGPDIRRDGREAADGGRQARPGVDDGRGEEGASAPLDAESLAFLEEFLSAEPKVRFASGADVFNLATARSQILKTQANALPKQRRGAQARPVFNGLKQHCPLQPEAFPAVVPADGCGPLPMQIAIDNRLSPRYFLALSELAVAVV
ncbi:hypothetical protein ACVFMH_17610 [Pseudomonas aeruginosa]